jgi:hypothetical protein
VIARTVTLVATLFVSQSCQPQAPRQGWQIVYSSPLGTYFVNQGSVRRDGVSVTVTTKFVAEGRSAGRTLTSEHRFDCRARTSTVLRAAFRDRDGRDVIIPGNPDEPEPVAGHAALEAAMNHVCPGMG